LDKRRVIAILHGIPSINVGGLAWLVLAGSIPAGFGFGAGFLGALRTVLPLAPPDERAALISFRRASPFAAWSDRRAWWFRS